MFRQEVANNGCNDFKAAKLNATNLEISGCAKKPCKEYELFEMKRKVSKRNLERRVK